MILDGFFIFYFLFLWERAVADGTRTYRRKVPDRRLIRACRDANEYNFSNFSRRCSDSCFPALLVDYIIMCVSYVEDGNLPIGSCRLGTRSHLQMDSRCKKYLFHSHDIQIHM